MSSYAALVSKLQVRQVAPKVPLESSCDHGALVEHRPLPQSGLVQNPGPLLHLLRLGRFSLRLRIRFFL